MKTKLMTLAFVLLTTAFSFKSFATECNSLCEITDCREDCPEFANGKPAAACIAKCEEANDRCEQKIFWCDYSAIERTKSDSELNAIKNVRP